MKISRSILEEVAYEAELETDPEVSDGPYLQLTYSGRGMYGDYCVGVVGAGVGAGVGDAIAFAVALIDDERVDVDVDNLRNARTDNMGLSMIVYWPRIQVEDDE